MEAWLWVCSGCLVLVMCSSGGRCDFCVKVRKLSKGVGVCNLLGVSAGDKCIGGGCCEFCAEKKIRMEVNVYVCV